jgi:hypothetical protein
MTLSFSLQSSDWRNAQLNTSLVRCRDNQLSVTTIIDDLFKLIGLVAPKGLKIFQ